MNSLAWYLLGLVTPVLVYGVLWCLASVRDFLWWHCYARIHRLRPDLPNGWRLGVTRSGFVFVPWWPRIVLSVSVTRWRENDPLRWVIGTEPPPRPKRKPVRATAAATPEGLADAKAAGRRQPNREDDA